MRIVQNLTTILLITLLTFTASGAVNAKVVSGSQHLTLLGSDTPAGGLVGEDLESAITAGIRVERFNRQLHTVEMQWIKDNAEAFAKALLKEGEEPTAEDIALAEERLLKQAFRQVQFGVEGKWDKEAHVYLSHDTGHYLDYDPSLSDLGPAVSFYADPYQKAAIHMFADHVAPNVAFYQRNGIAQPSFEQILTAAERDGEQRGRHLKQFLVGAAVTGTLVLAPVVAGSSIAAAVAAFAKDPVGYCLVNPASCTVAAETVACTVVEGCPINSVVHASKSATAKSIAKATGNNNLDNVAKILADASKRRGDDVVKGEVPHGFKTPQEFADFGNDLNSGLRNAGIDDAQGVFQGSAVTGKKYTTGEPFDVGRTSDFDIAISSPSLLQKAKDAGISLRSQGTRTGPLRPAELKELGLYELRQSLSQKAGRKVEFMLYESTSAATGRAPSIVVPK